MNKKALVVIDIQNDITKLYRNIIDRLNAAIYTDKGCKVRTLAEYQHSGIADA